MATATLTFDLDNPDDRTSHLQCVKARDLSVTLWTIKTNLKKNCENHMDAHPGLDGQDLLDYVWQRIHDECADNNINIEELCP